MATRWEEGGEGQACGFPTLRQAVASLGPGSRRAGRQRRARGLPTPIQPVPTREDGGAAAAGEGPGEAAEAPPSEWPFSQQLILLQKQRLLDLLVRKYKT